MHTAQLDNYQLIRRKLHGCLFTLHSFFMYEKTPSLTGSGTQFYVLELSVHTSSEK